MIKYETLENKDFKILHKAFLEAFSDYTVKFQMSPMELQNMLERRGFISEASIGAFENEKLIGFILNGVRNLHGKNTAYDTGTAVIKEYREQGITSNIFQNVRELLKKRGVKQYLLEVIVSNIKAVELYKKQGFKISRDLYCYYLDKSKYNFTSNYEVKHLKNIDENMWKELMEFWDFEPSWQNSIDSIKAVFKTFTCSIITIDNNIAGYGIIHRETGDIPQIAVNKNYRRRGVGKSIISDLINNTEGNKINILNVDSTSESMKNFLGKLDFENKVNQHEMILELL